jgi:hypothetical protein
VPLEHLLDDFCDATGLRVSERIIPMYPGVIPRETTLHGFAQESRTIWGLLNIILNVLKHPPG